MIKITRPKNAAKIFKNYAHKLRLNTCEQKTHHGQHAHWEVMVDEWLKSAVLKGDMEESIIAAQETYSLKIMTQA